MIVKRNFVAADFVLAAPRASSGRLQPLDEPLLAVVGIIAVVRAIFKKTDLSQSRLTEKAVSILL
jgi:hypothetical protein